MDVWTTLLTNKSVCDVIDFQNSLLFFSTATVRLVLTLLGELKEQQSTLTRMVQTLMRQSSSIAEEAAQLPDNIHLPISTHLELDDLEEQLAEKTFQMKLVSLHIFS